MGTPEDEELIENLAIEKARRVYNETVRQAGRRFDWEVREAGEVLDKTLDQIKKGSQSNPHPPAE